MRFIRCPLVRQNRHARAHTGLSLSYAHVLTPQMGTDDDLPGVRKNDLTKLALYQVLAQHRMRLPACGKVLQIGRQCRLSMPSERRDFHVRAVSDGECADDLDPGLPASPGPNLKRTPLAPRPRPSSRQLRMSVSIKAEFVNGTN